MKEIIIDHRTDHVYFVQEIVSYKCWKTLYPCLKEFDIPISFVRKTKDLWLRDFMPIQITADRFIQFVYQPDYLRDLPQYRTNPNALLNYLDIPVELSSIVLDGGNVIKCDDCVILSDKVFLENPSFSRVKLINQLEETFQAKVVIIPRDPLEMCGHADGMVRYLGDGKLLLNHYVDFDSSLRKKLLYALTPRFECEELHLGTDRFLNTSWAYLNYMQVGAHLFVPCFENRLDEIAYHQLEACTSLPVHPIPCRSTVKLGGGLNCLSWTIQGFVPSGYTRLQAI